MVSEELIPAERRSLRVPFPVELVSDAETGAARFLGYGSNVSETGLFVQCSNPRPMGTDVDLKLHLPARSSEGAPVVVHGAATVVWTRGFGGRSRGAPGMGVRFRSIAIADLVALREFCEAFTVIVEGACPQPEEPQANPRHSWVDAMRRRLDEFVYGRGWADSPERRRAL